MKLTKGEYLDALGAAIAYQYERERIRITQAKPGDKAGIARDMVYVDQRQAKRVATLAANRERYKGRLQEVATVTNIQPNVVHRERSRRVPGDRAAAASTFPSTRWTRRWPSSPRRARRSGSSSDGPRQLNHPANKRLHDAIVNNFDFEFLYNSFFAPEKVKGRSYAPLHNPAAVAPVVTTTASASSKARAADPNVYLLR